MAWRFEPGEALPEAFRRVAAEEIANIQTDLSSCDADRDRAVHQARRRFKRLRALLRLASPSLGAQFAAENRHWREAGRKLAAKRDAAVLGTSFDAIAGRCGNSVPEAALARLRAHITGAGPSPAGGSYDFDRVLHGVRGELDEAKERLGRLDWPESRKDLSRGLRQSQRRLRKSWKRARGGSDPEALHEWRKRVKDQMAQLGLLREVIPDDLKERRKDEKRAAELLGEDLDMLVLCKRLAGAIPPGTEAGRDMLLRAIAARRQELRSEALGGGEALSRQTAKHFAKQLASCWEEASRSEAPPHRGRRRKAALQA
jgi:CHAD domain-containing protein